MKRGLSTTGAPWLTALLLCGLVASSGCRKKRSRPNPWARALPRSTAAYGLPAQPDAKVTLNRGQVLVSGKPLLKLKDGRLGATALRDGAGGLYVPKLAKALAPLSKKRADGSVSHGRLAVLCQPAVPFRTLRAVLYTAMRAGFTRPWLLAEGPGGKRVGLPLELPSVVGHRGHGLRPAPARTPALAVGVDGTALHVTRWGSADCPPGNQAGSAGCSSLSPKSLSKGLARLRKHLTKRYRDEGGRPGRRRPPSNAIMVWAGLDTPVGHFVKLLDAVRETTGPGGPCRIQPDEKTHHWKRTSPLASPTGMVRGGCLYHQTVLVWSRPGHRKQ